MQALYLATMQLVPNSGLEQMTALVSSAAGEGLWVVASFGTVLLMPWAVCVMFYSCTWKYFLLARVWDAKPKATLFVAYKLPG